MLDQAHRAGARCRHRHRDRKLAVEPQYERASVLSRQAPSDVVEIGPPEAEGDGESENARRDGEKFSRIAAGLGTAVEELQELSRGIHPAILFDAGLGPALEALALRSPIPVALEVMTEERFPEPVEVAAYFVASESLANAAKHSRSTRIDVALTRETEGLLLSVSDDGIGGADPGRGSGLVGLRDRVEALGGSLAIKSKAGDGTSVVATLPCRDELEDDPSGIS